MRYLSLITLTALLGLASCGHFTKGCCHKDKCHRSEKVCKENCHKSKKKDAKECKEHCDKKAEKKKS